MASGLLGGLLEGVGAGGIAQMKIDQAKSEEDTKWERLRAELVAKFAIEDAKGKAADARSQAQADAQERRAYIMQGIDPDTGQPIEGSRAQRGGARGSRGGSGGGDTSFDLNTPEGRDAAARMVGITGPEAATALDYQQRGGLNPGILEANPATSLENFQDANAAQAAEDKINARVRPGLLRNAQAMQQVTFGKDLPNVVQGQVASDLAAGTRNPADVNTSEAALKGEAVKVVPADARMQDVSGNVVGKKNPQTFAPKDSGGEKALSAEQKRTNAAIDDARRRINSMGMSADEIKLKARNDKALEKLYILANELKYGEGIPQRGKDTSLIIKEAGAKYGVKPGASVQEVRDAIKAYRARGYSIDEIRGAFERLGVK